MQNFFLSVPRRKFILVLLCLSFLFFVVDIITNPCFSSAKPIGLYLFLFFHHVVATFLYIGWIAASKTILLIYVFLVWVIVVHWITNDQKCILTQIVNYYCGSPDDEGFHDIFYVIGMKQQSWFNAFIYSYLLLTSFYSLYKVFLSDQVF
jgi:hypothetical protein